MVRKNMIVVWIIIGYLYKKKTPQKTNHENNYIFYIKKGVFLNIDILNITAAIQTGARAHIK